MYLKSLYLRSLPLIIVGILLLCSIPSGPSFSPPHEPLGGMVGTIRGGFGVKAPIDNYQIAWGNRPVTWVMEIEGDFVLFGYSSGTIAAMGKGTARSSLLPPAIGFGPVTVTLTITAEGSVLEHTSRNGHMIGPFILLGF